ncbi:MAG: NADPH-dependent reductase [Firmicutes bacterium]|nr:NADPH-dependent reductase [Bacillota bacterium]
MKKVVALMGSPRKNGNTATIIGEILKGAQDAGAETNLFNLIDMNIKPCVACYYCRQHEGCAVKDDMQAVYEAIKNADAVIMGSPVYMFQVTGQMKMLMDRLYPLLSGENGSYALRYGKKQTVTVYSQGADDSNYFQEYFIYNQKVLDMLGLEAVDHVLCCGANDRRFAAGNSALMQRAYAIGKKLAE